MCTPVRDERCPGRIVVYKFGSSVLADGAAFRAAARRVRAAVDAGQRVVSVVSAVVGATDALLAMAAALSAGPPARLVSRLLATGEMVSVALLAMALEDAGVPSLALGPEALGLRTTGALLEAEPRSLEGGALAEALARAPAVVVPGFVGIDPSGEPSLLGRGGSDWTALFLAQRLGAAACVLVKDTDGVYAADPKVVPDARRLDSATWDEVLALGGGVVQPRALRWARDQGMPFTVEGPCGLGTVVGPRADVRAEVRT